MRSGEVLITGPFEKASLTTRVLIIDEDGGRDGDVDGQRVNEGTRAPGKVTTFKSPHDHGKCVTRLQSTSAGWINAAVLRSGRLECLLRLKRKRWLKLLLLYEVCSMII